MKYHHPYPCQNRFRYKARRKQHWIEHVAYWELRQAEPMVCFHLQIPARHDDALDAKRMAFAEWDRQMLKAMAASFADPGPRETGSYYLARKP